MSVALWAWIVLGAIVLLVVLIMVIIMIPEMVRYMKLKSM